MTEGPIFDYLVRTHGEAHLSDMLGVIETRQAIGSTRACPEPGCGRPQHYSGVELGWCHDALVDTWHCADPRKAGA